MSLPSGTQLGPYEVLASLGAGGMGEVYRAKDSKLKRDVAIKVLPADVASDRERLARFQREAELLAALNHPNIAHLYGIEDAAEGQSDVRPYIVMELVEGEDLAQRLARGPIPLDEALPITKQIADALEAAHEQGIIHRDLKPANIKVRDDGTVKVLDFGLAKAMEGDGFSRRRSAEAGASALQGLANSPTITSPAMIHLRQGYGGQATQVGVILGTAAYMAPEQAKGKPVDKRADIWAFGCVLYEMLTGRKAFDGEDITDTIAAVVTRDPDWSRLPATTPASIRRLLMRCLAKDRKHRLRDIGDAHELVDQSPDPATAVVMPPLRLAHWIPTGAALLAALMLAVPAISHWRESPPSPRPMRLTIDAPANAVRLLSPEISPDGRAVAFASIAAGALAPQLWIRRLDESVPILAPGPIDANGAPFWAPDGRALAVPTRETLLHVDLASGGTRPLADIRSTLVGVAQFSGTWGRDGVILYGLGSTIFRVSESGGDSRPLQFDGIPAGNDNRFPSFLPDGRRFFFLTREPGQPSTAYVASVEGGPVTRLFAADSQVVYTEPSPGRGFVLFVRDGNLMAQRFDQQSLTASGSPAIVARSVPLYAAEFVGTGRGAFSASRDGVVVYNSQSEALLQRLVWLDRTGKEIGSVGEPALYFGPRISPEGRRIAVSRLDPISRLGDIYVFSESGGSQRLTFDSANDLQPVWTPDGQFVIWGSQRREKSQLVRKRADGSGGEELLHESDYPLGPDDVSRDGRFLVFRESRTDTRNDLWILPLDGSGSARPLLNTVADEPRARFSPDGKFISYISNASGQMEAYIQPFPEMDGKWQVSNGAGIVPQWRADGREIFFAERSGLVSRTVLDINPLRLGPTVALFAPPVSPRGSFFHVSADGQRFLFAPERLTPDALRFHVAIDWAAPE